MENRNKNQSETTQFLLKLSGHTHAIDDNTAKFLLGLGASKYEMEPSTCRKNDNPINYTGTDTGTEKTLISLSDWLQTNGDQVYSKSTMKNKRRQNQSKKH